MSMVRFKRGEVPPLSDEELAALRAMPPADDSEIDYSDIPPLTDEEMKRAIIPSPFYRPVKKQLSLRIDVDVIEWLKEGGNGWQTRLNAYLRREMIRDRRKAAQAKAEAAGAKQPETVA